MSLKFVDGAYTVERQSKKKSIVTVDTPNILERLNAPGNDYYELDSNHFILVEETAEEPGTNSLPVGTYLHVMSNFGTNEQLVPSSPRTGEQYLDLGSIEKLSADINIFLQSKEIYEKVRTPYRRGYLLYGPPGNGKTALIRELTKKYKDQAVIIWCTNIPSSTLLQEINNTEALKIVIFEEIVQGMDSNISLSSFLEFMDGELSLKNCITIATTNYPERLTANLANRPSRFDVVYNVDNPGKLDAHRLLSIYLGYQAEEDASLDLSVLSVAQLKEVALLTLMYKIPVIDAYKRLVDHIKAFKNEFQKRKQLGLGGDDE